MPLRSISRQTLELLYQNVRSPGVMPRGVLPGRGDAAAPSDASFAVADDLIRVIPFVRVDDGPFARQYMLRTADAIDEPPYVARGGATTAWTPGTTLAFGEELEPVGTRFKKISATVRIDELMSAEIGDDVLEVQITLARIGIVRALSEAILHSNPASDDAQELAGLPFYLPAGGSQDVDYDPARGTIGGLAETEARCHPGDDGLGSGPCAFVMSSRARWRLMKEMEDKGLQPDIRWCPMLEREELHFHGLPVLGGRVPEPQDASPATEAWALKLTGPSAVRVLHIEGDSFGLREDPITTVTGLDSQGEAASATRGVEVYGLYAVLVPDPLAIARLRGIPAGDPFSQP